MSEFVDEDFEETDFPVRQSGAPRFTFASNVSAHQSPATMYVRHRGPIHALVLEMIPPWYLPAGDKDAPPPPTYRPPEP
jgi:hypothetical protein